MVRNKLHYLLIRYFNISKKEAFQCIETGQVVVNQQVVHENIFIKKTDEVKFEDVIIQKPFQFTTILYNKPRGIECTLNEDIEQNLKLNLPFEEHLFPIGRLDKESEGLLILTNDGQLYRTLNHQNSTVEKEYEVTVNQRITDDFLFKMSNGIEIMGKKTLPCILKKIDDFTFSIILIEGRNRQIRRMCYKLNYEVLSLKRTRFGEFHLGCLKSGEYKILN